MLRTNKMKKLINLISLLVLALCGSLSFFYNIHTADA